MKKKDFKSLIYLALVLSSKTFLIAETKSVQADPAHGNMGYFLMSEDDLLLELNEEGAKQYASLSPEGKELARKVASRRCNASNECKGLNACATDKNDCAGKGDCKGQSKCGFSDKNLAVKVVFDKMAEKRKSLK